MIRATLGTFLSLLFVANADAQQKLKEIHVKVDGVGREALVHFPNSTAKAPVVFAFHGHGGSAEKASKQFDFQQHWPQAISVYMQGIPIVSATDPAGKKPGWQHDPGEVRDRDLKFFDAVLARIKKEHAVDENRIYATGHSNGGGFTYLLWATRGDVFAAFAPSAAAYHKFIKDCKPRPAMHVAGKNDTTAPFDFQMKMMNAVRALNGCDDASKPYHKIAVQFPSKTGTPFVELIHNGGHDFPEQAPPLMATFFKEHKK